MNISESEMARHPGTRALLALRPQGIHILLCNADAYNESVEPGAPGGCAASDSTVNDLCRTGLVGQPCMVFPAPLGRLGGRFLESSRWLVV
jgi:hypothetical protein